MIYTLVRQPHVNVKKLNRRAADEMNYETLLQQFIENSDGTILTKEVEKVNIPRQYLIQFQKQGKLEHISHGIYITPDTKKDMLYYVQLRSKEIIFSGETAAAIHKLYDKQKDMNDSVLTITVPQSYATNRLRSSGFNVKTVKNDVHDLGKTIYLTPYHHKVQVYDLERTICDLVKSRNKIEKDFFYGVLKQYVQQPNKDYNKLILYAKKLRVRNILEQYLEMTMA